MTKMLRNGVTEEELLELAAQVGFEIKNDEDLLKLFRTARNLGWWKDMDIPKLDPKHGWWAPPEEGNIRYIKNPWPDPEHSKADIKALEERKTEKLTIELDKLTQLADALEAKLPTQNISAHTPAEVMENIDKWLDEIK